jgi:hypothetical protein
MDEHQNEHKDLSWQSLLAEYSCMKLQSATFLVVSENFISMGYLL